MKFELLPNRTVKRVILRSDRCTLCSEVLRSHITLTVCIFSFIFHNRLLRALLSCLRTSLLLIAVITVFLFTWRAALLLHSSSNLKNDVRVPVGFLKAPVTCCHQGERHRTNDCGWAQMSSCSHLHFLVIIGIDVFAETLHICTICNKGRGSAEAARLIIKVNQPSTSRLSHAKRSSKNPN